MWLSLSISLPEPSVVAAASVVPGVVAAAADEEEDFDEDEDDEAAAGAGASRDVCDVRRRFVNTPIILLPTPLPDEIKPLPAPDRKSTRLNSSHTATQGTSRMPSSA